MSEYYSKSYGELESIPADEPNGDEKFTCEGERLSFFESQKQYCEGYQGAGANDYERCENIADGLYQQSGDLRAQLFLCAECATSRQYQNAGFVIMATRVRRRQ